MSRVNGEERSPAAELLHEEIRGRERLDEN